jgi:pimeloyl-ACP methyl ester carboxylesterase
MDLHGSQEGMGSIEGLGRVGLDAPRPGPRGPGALLPHLWKTERLWTPCGATRFHARVALRAAPLGARAVVLVHGLGASSRALTPTLMRLASSHRAYAPDLPGFGLTTRPRRPMDCNGLADALAEWMQATGVGRASLLAHSSGCQVAVRFALRHPERLDKLILQGPTLDPEGRGALRHLGRVLRNSPREPATLGALRLMDSRDAGPWCLLRSFAFALHERLEELLPEVRHPTLVVHGAKDPLVPEAWARRMVELLPHGRRVTLPGGAHCLPYDAPLELVRVVRPFLEEAVPTDGVTERQHP